MSSITAVNFSRLEEVLVLSPPSLARGLLPRAAPVPARVEDRQ